MRVLIRNAPVTFAKKRIIVSTSRTIAIVWKVEMINDRPIGEKGSLDYILSQMYNGLPLFTARTNVSPSGGHIATDITFVGRDKILNEDGTVRYVGRSTPQLMWKAVAEYFALDLSICVHSSLTKGNALCGFKEDSLMKRLDKLKNVEKQYESPEYYGQSKEYEIVREITTSLRGTLNQKTKYGGKWLLRIFESAKYREILLDDSPLKLDFDTKKFFFNALEDLKSDAVISDLVQKFKTAQSKVVKRLVLSVVAPYYTLDIVCCLFETTHWQVTQARVFASSERAKNGEMPARKVYICSSANKALTAKHSALLAFFGQPGVLNPSPALIKGKEVVFKCDTSQNLYLQYLQFANDNEIGPLSRAYFFNHINNKGYKNKVRRTCLCDNCEKYGYGNASFLEKVLKLDWLILLYYL